MFNCFQNISLIFAFNFSSKHRKYFYSNKSYLFYLSCITFFCIFLITSSNVVYFFPYKNPLVIFDYGKFNHRATNMNERYKFLLIVFVIINFVITMFWEKFIDLILPEKDDKVLEKKNIKEILKE